MAHLSSLKYSLLLSSALTTITTKANISTITTAHANMDDEAASEFTEVKPSNWNKNKRNKPSSSSFTPIPSYSPTTPWPTYSPTTLEDKAEWLKKKQKYLKNRDKVPESVWESDEATVGKKKQAWLEKQKDKKSNISDNESNTEKEEEEAANSDKSSTEDQQQEVEKASIPTPTPTYYDPPLVPTKKQKQLEKRAKLAAQQQNTTDNEASDNVAPTAAPIILDSLSPSYSPSGTPTVGDIPTAQQVLEIPTKKRKKQAEKEAQLAEETTKAGQEPSYSPTMSRVSSTASGRYTGASREPPKSRNPPVAKTKGNETDVTVKEPEVQETKEESEPEVQETKEESEPEILETNENVSNNNEKKTSTSEKVSLILAPEDLEKAAAVRDAPRPTRAPVEPTKTVKVNFTFINNRVKKRVTPAPTPASTSGEPTYLLFPTLAPTDRHPTYVPTAAWTWKPSANKGRSKNKETSLFDKRICPSDNLFFESELRSAAETGDSVFFTYGIQTSKDGDIDIEEAVEKIQLWLLEDVARTLLHCSKNALDFGGNDGKGVLSSVYYSKDDRQYAKQCNPTTSEANLCAIVSSTLRFEAVDQEMKARPKVLAVIFNQLQSGFDARLEKANILDLAYLGPELGYQQPHDDLEVKDTHTSSSSIPTSAYAAIGVASVVVFALILCLAMGYKLRKERRRPSSSPTISSYRDVASHHQDNYSYTPSDSRRSYYR
eukprot:scaffold2520_cov135-Skeletonema_menzelii.AAC.2